MDLLYLWLFRNRQSRIHMRILKRRIIIRDLQQRHPPHTTYRSSITQVIGVMLACKLVLLIYQALQLTSLLWCLHPPRHFDNFLFVVPFSHLRKPIKRVASASPNDLRHVSSDCVLLVHYEVILVLPRIIRQPNLIQQLMFHPLACICELVGQSFTHSY